jgi:NADH:ubiquinone oxidoreductase subunit F (NADH-binding)
VDLETRLALKNVGNINPNRIESYTAAGGYDALKIALGMPPERIVSDLINSGLRGRGGAGFSTGLKKKFTSESTCQLLECMRYIVCNADEGEPGTFKDRIIMENDPHLLIEGMTIAAYAVGADKGYIYIRGEYARAIERTRQAVENAYKTGFLGENILGSGYALDLEIKIGAGSYLCGEELTLLESIEGKRGYPRVKPPYPAESGLFNMPTLVNNVETLSHIPSIVARGADWYRGLGTPDSPGTKIFTISGDVERPGYYEVEMGVPLRELIHDLAGGIKQNKKFKTALLGGAAGTFVPESLLDIPMAFETLKEKGATLGSGAIIVLARDKSIVDILESILRFFQHESCGKCVPCRIGTRQLCVALEALKRGANGKAAIVDDLVHQARFMANTSLCPLGQSPILPIESAVRYFRDEF